MRVKQRWNVSNRQILLREHAPQKKYLRLIGNNCCSKMEVWVKIIYVRVRQKESYHLFVNLFSIFLYPRAEFWRKAGISMQSLQIYSTLCLQDSVKCWTATPLFSCHKNNYAWLRFREQLRHFVAGGHVRSSAHFLLKHWKSNKTYQVEASYVITILIILLQNTMLKFLIMSDVINLISVF
jgi:hypothetical protein